MDNQVKKTVGEKAKENFKIGFNCAESVLKSLADEMGIECLCIPKISTGFGAGLGRHGEICGAITGAVMALGLKYGRSDTKDPEAKEKSYSIVDGFIKTFESKFKNVRCIDLTGCNMLTPEGLQKVKDDNVHKNVCTDLVVFAATEAAKLLT
ncbi:MAG: C-GCAxxG-C-C family protein [Actinobacteria bacterium]|nr:C-GCAxxG-C-C family protein [Actinomycetota bacterium]